jgi:quinohemoprotein ethanol dehydrogenase
MPFCQPRWSCSTILVVLLGTTAACGPYEPAPRLEQPGSPEHIRRVTAEIDDARLAGAAQDPGNWLTHGRTYDEQRFSPLDQIHEGNVEELGLAWSFDLATERGVESTPLAVDGILFVTAPWSVVYALDARSGEQLWRWDPQVARGFARHACRSTACRAGQGDHRQRRRGVRRARLRVGVRRGHR